MTQSADPGAEPTTTGVDATGERSVGVGGDNLGVILTGDGNTVLFGAGYERLSDSYLNPSSLYRNCDLEHFTGREATIADIDDFMAKHDRGYVEIEGGLGVGKTTLLAHLASQRGYLHHFVQLMPNKGDIGVAMRNLAAQLVSRFDLSAWAPGGSLPTSASRPEVFLDILEAALRRRRDSGDDSPIVFVIDGLDEAGEPQAGNPLALPRQLSPGVFFIVAHRDVYVPLAVDPPKRPLVLTTEESRGDMETFLRAAVNRPEIARLLHEEGPNAAETFIETLLDKTAGLWLYLSYVLVEIETGSRAPADLKNLPGGLWQYYEQFWRTWQRDHGDEWVGVHQPLLSTLGAARESLTAEFLAELAGIPEVHTVEDLLDDAWKPFLDIDGSSAQTRYGVSQASFRAFLEGQVDVRLLNQAEQRTVRRTADATRQRHGRIADRYLAAWGGLDQNLPGLKSSSAASMDAGYGLRHLAEHLIGAGRVDELHRLLAASWESTETSSDAPAGRVVNAWRQAQEDAGMLAVYLNDVSNAWRLVTAACRPRIEEGSPAPEVSLELRYALLCASVSSMAANVPPALLVALCNRGRISTEEALAYARRGPDPLSRVEALLALSDVVDPPALEVLREALVSCRAVEDEQLRTGALALLAPRLPAEWRSEASDLAASIVDVFWRAAATRVVETLLGCGPRALDGIAPSDPGDESWHDERLALPHAVSVAQSLRDRHGEALARMTARLPDEPSGDQIAEALTAARAIPQDRWRAEALTVIAQRISDGPARLEVLEEALASARAVGDSAQHAVALAALARQLIAAGRPAAALETAKAIKDAYRRTATLAELMDALPPEQRDDALTSAARGLAEITDTAQRARVLAHQPTLVRMLASNDDVIEETRRVVRDERWRAVVLSSLLPILDGDATAGALGEAFDSASRLPPGHDRADVLVRLAPALPAPLVDEALTLISSVKEPDEHAMAAGALCVRLVELGRAEQAMDVLAAIDDGYGREEAAARVAEALASSTPDGAALDAARTITYPHWRAAALGQLSARAPEPELAAQALREALDAANGAASKAAVAEALVLVAESAAPADAAGVLDRAVVVAREVADPHDQARVLTRITSTMEAAGRLDEALDIAERIDDQQWQALALRAVVGRINDPAMVRRVLRIVDGLDDSLDRAHVIVALLPALIDAPLADLYSPWRTVLRLLGAHTRRDLLIALPELLPGLQRLGGADAVIDGRDIVESVRRWWP